MKYLAHLKKKKIKIKDIEFPQIPKPQQKKIKGGIKDNGDQNDTSNTGARSNFTDL